MQSGRTIVRVVLGLTILLSAKAAYSAEGFAVQGLLQSAAGARLADGVYNMRFSLMDGPSSAVVWRKSIAGVPVSNGVMSARLSGNDDAHLALTTVFASAPVFSGTAPRDMTVDIDVDLDNDGVYEDSFHGLPVTSVPFSMIADRCYGVVDGAITASSLASLSVTSAKIANATLEFSKLAQNGATIGSVIQWNGTAWTAAAVTGAAGGTVTSVSGTGPITVSNASSTPNITIADATDSTKGAVQIGAGLAVSGGVASLNFATSGVSSSTQAVRADDARLTNARAPSGVAGGDLTGSYPSPTLTATGVTAGTYSKVTVDAKGRVTAGAALGASDLPGLAVATSSSAGTVKATAGYLTLDTGGAITALHADTSTTATSANGIRGAAISTTAPTAGQILKYDSASSTWIPATLSSTDVSGLMTAAVTSLNGDSTSAQSLSVGTAGTDFGLVHAGGAHTFNLPTASASNRGALSAADWASFNAKEAAVSSGTSSQYYRGDKTWASFASDARAVISAAGSLSYSAITGIMSLGTVPLTSGGTGLTTSGSANQIMGMNSAGDRLEYKSLNGTSHQVGITQAAGALTLSLPQDMHTAATPTFAGLNLTGLSGVVRATGGTLSAGALTMSDVTTALGYTPQAPVSAASDLSVGSLSTAKQAGVVLAPYDTTTGKTGEMRFLELAANGTQYVGFKAPDALTSSLVWTLPSTLGTNNQVLTTDNAGNLSWTTPTAATTVGDASVSTKGVMRVGSGLSDDGAGVVSVGWAASGTSSTTQSVRADDSRLSNSRAPAGTASGDLAGTYPSPTLSTTGVAAGTYAKVTVDTKGRVTSGAGLAAADLPIATNGATGALRATTGYVALNSTGDITNVHADSCTLSATATSANGLQGEMVSSVSPHANQVLQYNGTSWVPTTLPAFPTSPTSSTNQAIPKWSGTAGGSLVDSNVTIDGSDNLRTTGYVQAGTATAGVKIGQSSTSYAVVGAVGSATNIPLVLAPQGTGALQAQLTDSGATGGNARGANAVDLQTSRGIASQVASGTGAVIGGGSGNAASGNFATVVGGIGAAATQYGEVARAAGSFAASGDAQVSEFVLRNTTANATATELFLDGSAARLLIPDSTSMGCQLEIVGRQSGGVNMGYFNRRIFVSRDTGATSATLVTVIQTLLTDMGTGTLAGVPTGGAPNGWAVNVAADNVNGSIKVQVTGVAATNIRWVASVRCTRVAY